MEMDFIRIVNSILTRKREGKHMPGGDWLRESLTSYGILRKNVPPALGKTKENRERGNNNMSLVAGIHHVALKCCNEKEFEEEIIMRECVFKGVR